MAFLRERGKDQEERNEHLIKVNGELQRKVDSILKSRQGNPAMNYYKEQCERLERDNEGFKGKLKQVGEECKGYRLELATKNTKLSQEYEFKVLQLELAVQEQQRKIILLQSERATGGVSDDYRSDKAKAGERSRVETSGKLEGKSKAEGKSRGN